MTAEPENLGRDMKRGRVVTSQAVDSHGAEPLAKLSRLGRRAIVAVHKAWPNGLTAGVDGDDRRALAGQADGSQPGGGSEAADRPADDRERSKPPLVAVLLCPAWSWRDDCVPAPHLEQPVAFEVEAHGSCPRGPNVDCQEDVPVIVDHLLPYAATCLGRRPTAPRRALPALDARPRLVAGLRDMAFSWSRPRRFGRIDSDVGIGT